MVVTKSAACRVSLIPSPVQQTARPRAYTLTMADSDSTGFVTVNISESSDPVDISLNGAPPSLPESTLTEVTLTQPTMIPTSQTPSVSLRPRLKLWSTGRKLHRRRLHPATTTDTNPIRLPLETRLKYLELMNQRLLLKITLLEPLQGHVKDLVETVAVLEKRINEFRTIDGTVSVSVGTDTSVDGSAVTPSHDVPIRADERDNMGQSQIAVHDYPPGPPQEPENHFPEKNSRMIICPKK